MNIATQRNIGAFIEAKNAILGNQVVAGAAGDGLEQDGYWNDRSRRLSGVLVITYVAVLAQDETLSIGGNLQDATDAAGTGAADYGDALASAVVATGDTGGSTEIGTVEIDVDLSGAREFVRGQFTPTLSAASIDTVDLAAVLILSGGDQYPL